MVANAFVEGFDAENFTEEEVMSYVALNTASEDISTYLLAPLTISTAEDPLVFCKPIAFIVSLECVSE